jgi:hypothetical protein
MTLHGVRRPRIVEPRCLRCRRPLWTGVEEDSIEAYCSDCLGDGWYGSHVGTVVG